MRCQAKMDENTCDECAYFNATDATPPITECTNPNGCRCAAVPDDDDPGDE